jgi:hypothetical protein
VEPILAQLTRAGFTARAAILPRIWNGERDPSQEPEAAMMITINVPDSLPPERVRQRIREIESSLLEEAQFWETTTAENPSLPVPEKDAAFFQTFGSWQDDRDAEALVREILESRRPSKRTASL